MRRLASLKLGEDAMLNEATMHNFRNFLEMHGLLRLAALSNNLTRRPGPSQVEDLYCVRIPQQSVHRSHGNPLKAEVMALGEDTRFIVTSLPGLDAGTLYEDIYCARGQAENYITYLNDELAIPAPLAPAF